MNSAIEAVCVYCMRARMCACIVAYSLRSVVAVLVLLIDKATKKNVVSPHTTICCVAVIFFFLLLLCAFIHSVSFAWRPPFGYAFFFFGAQYYYYYYGCCCRLRPRGVCIQSQCLIREFSQSVASDGSGTA